MTTPIVPAIGVVLSADIAVPDHEREVQFYARVLGTGEVRLWRDDLKNTLGMPIVGLGERSDEYAALPLQWMPHIQVADVSTSVARALEGGGTVLMQTADDAAGGPWAVLLDPNGAAFGVVPVVPAHALPSDASSDAGAGGPVGRIAWLDLTVPDAAATRDFYQSVAGWSVQDVAMKDPGATEPSRESYADYLMIAAGGVPAAGVCHARGTNAGLPPVWLLYLPVGDLAESLRRVTEEGGSVVRTARGKTGEPTYAVIRDPVGAYLALVPPG